VKTLARLGGAAAMAALLAACQTLGATPRLVSTVTAKVPDDVSSALAMDIASQLKIQLGVGETNIRLKGDGSAFGEALERALRDLGFAVGTESSPAQTPSAIDLAYTLDGDDTALLVRVSTGELDLTRLYRIAPDGVVPAGPVSVLHRRAGANG
jgi:type IV secretion system protein TrbH